MNAPQADHAAALAEPPQPPRQPRRSWGISAKLIGLLLSVFLIFLTAVTVTGYLLYRHEGALRELFTGHFERAMLAGELARDAEVLNAQIFERMLGNQKSVVDGNPTIKNQMAILQNTRDKLAASGQISSAALADIDRLQREYFASIRVLEEKIGNEAVKQQSRNGHLEAVLGLLHQVDAQIPPGKGSHEQIALADAMHALLACVAAAEAGVGPGQLRQLEDLVKTRSDNVRRLLANPGKSGLSPALQKLAAAMVTLSDQVFIQNNASGGSERATLATARETRVIAQKLGAAAVNYYLALRDVARQEMAEQATTVHSTLLFLIAFTVFTALISLLAIAYIIRRIAWRLRDLNAAMRAHVAGERVAIPGAGDDEIAEMGKAFAVFVNARDAAESELRRNQTLLAEAAVTDSLSGLPNRRGFDETLAREWQRCARHGEVLSIVMADIDFFKKYNDHYGHLAGDECIRRVGTLMRQSFDRSVDYPARFGGEEFVCILPGTAGDGAALVAERFRSQVAAAHIAHAESSITDHITISIGVASCHPDPAGNSYSLVQLADEALYRAKDRGRDRVQQG